MIFNSLKSRIIISVVGIVFIALTMTLFFVKQKAKQELSKLIEENAVNLLQTTKNNVESQYNGILYHKAAMLSRRKTELKNNTLIALAIINSAYRKFKQGDIDEATARQYVINDINRLRYDDGIGYFWINDTGRPYPRMVVHPTIPELNGNILDDPKFNCALDKGENLFKASVDLCLEKKEGYLDYLWPKPGHEGLTEEQAKISYVKLFKPWNWIIGTGVYIDDIEKDVQQRISVVIDDLNKIIIRQDIAGTGYFFIFDENNDVLVHPKIAGENVGHLVNMLTGNRLLEDLKKAASGSVTFMDYLWDKPGFEDDYQFPKKAYVLYYEPLGWYICFSVYKEDVEKKIKRLTQRIILFSALFFVAAFIISLIVSRSITNPLKVLIRSIGQTDKDGIPVERIVETGTSETKLLGSTINNMIDSVSRSRKALRQSEAKFRSLIESSCDWVWEMNQEGVYTYTSPRIEDMLGYKPDEILGRRIYDLMLPEEFERMNQIVRGLVFKGESAVGVENINVHKDGRQIVLETNGVPVFDESGNVTGFRGVTRDITKRKQAEEELAATHRQLRTVFDHSLQISIIATDANGLITVFNAGAERMLGYSAEEMVGKKTPLLIHLESEVIARAKELSEKYGQSVGGFDVFLARAGPGGYEEDEWTYVKKDGTLLTVNLITSILLDDLGNVSGLVGFAQDITERKHHEAELRRLRNYLSNIIDSMPSVLVGVDKACRVTLWNKTAENKTNTGADAARGQTLSLVFPQMAAEMENIRESIFSRELKQEKKRPRRTEIGTCYEDVTIYPLVANGEDGAVIQVNDVTEQVRLERMMVQSEKMVSVGGLAAGMAHEINNPVAGMMQTADVMANRLSAEKTILANIKAAEKAGTSMEAIWKFMELRGIPRMLKTINESGRRVADIVENMLSFARTDEARVSSYLLSELIDKTLELAVTDYDFKKQYDFKMIEIRKEYDENLPYVLCERTKIQQVLLNIFRNGAHAMQEAGIRNPLLILRAYPDKEGKKVVIEIEDNGPGMDSMTCKRIFEPFYTTKPVGVGTGLGLSVSYFIITENHGGEMAVESAPGCGAKFIIRLPLEKKI